MACEKTLFEKRVKKLRGLEREFTLSPNREPLHRLVRHGDERSFKFTREN